MTIAFDVGPLRPNPAGVGVYVRSLAQALAQFQRGDFAYVGRRPDAEGLPEAVPSVLRSARLPYSVWVEMLSPLAVRRARADLVHFTDGLVPLVRQRPTVVTVLDLSLVRQWRTHRAVRYLRIPLVLAAPRLADRVIAISQATADEVMRLTGTAANKIDVIPLAPRASAKPAPPDAIESVTRRHGLSKGSYLLVPGTIEPRKNHLRVVRAFEDLVRRHALPLEMTLVLAGSPGWKAATTLRAIDTSSARERIKVLGYVPEDDLAALMTDAAAIVYVSTYEGFGLPILEAMACGAPVVTSTVSSMPEAAGDAGILVDPFDPAAIAGGILSALDADDVARKRAMAHAATFTWDRTAQETRAVYDEMA
jgi:glycosyltransferase involved in cell wall biosynthesis